MHIIITGEKKIFFNINSFIKFTAKALLYCNVFLGKRPDIELLYNIGRHDENERI